MAFTYSEQNIAQYGQTEEQDPALIARFGYQVYNDESYLPNLSDRAVSLLIEEMRFTYGAG
jgi:hypothetical protein